MNGQTVATSASKRGTEKVSTSMRTKGEKGVQARGMEKVVNSIEVVCDISKMLIFIVFKIESFYINPTHKKTRSSQTIKFLSR